MKRQNRILAGTALATLMMTASAGFAFAVPNAAPLRVSQPLVYAQADVEDAKEAKKKKRKAEQRKETREKAAEDSGATKKQQAQAKRKQRAEQENAAADDSRQQKAVKKQASAKKKRQAEEAVRQADAAGEARQLKAAKSKQAREEQAAAKKQAAQATAKKKQQSAAAKALPVAALAQVPAGEPRLSDEEQGKAASRKLAQAEEPQGEAPAEERKKRKAEQAPAEEATPQQEEAAPEQPREEAAPEPQPEEAAPESQPEQAAPAEEPQREEAPAEQPQEAAPAEEAQPKQAAPAEEPQREEAAPAEESKPRKAKPSQDEAAPAEKPKRRKQAAEAQPEAPADQPAEAEQPAEASPEQPAEASPEGEAAPSQQPAEAAPAEPRQPAEAEAAPDDGKAAPVLDSQKRRLRGDGTGEGRRDRKKRPAGEGTEAAAPEPEAAPAGPPPADDRAAQETAQPKAIEPVTAERGTRRRDRSPDDDEPRRRERPEGSRVLREIGDRVVIQFNNQVIVESNDRPRMSRGAREVYYEDLPRGRTREIIVRRDGTQVVTVRNAYGDVIRRSRIAPDGEEYVLAYVDDGYYDRVRDWRDPGDDLPPMQLDMPVEEYIFDATTAEEPEAYYEFLEQPPVERVERLYSVDEVKRSARIRDKTRRIDMDTLTFEFGSASIAEDQIAKLDGVAQAMEKILAKNPAETFLIEGHTDAVGSDLANLALSDRRAEAVADALSNVFAIPPENLATQGYGEQYLKVRTQAPERENRRVAIRRITPLVAPVASAQ